MRGMLFSPFILIPALIGVVITIIPYCFIFRKAGFSPWLGLLMIVPGVNVIVLYVIAFVHWKVMPAATEQ